jgi:hypothetical protein
MIAGHLVYRTVPYFVYRPVRCFVQSPVGSVVKSPARYFVHGGVLPCGDDAPQTGADDAGTPKAENGFKTRNQPLAAALLKPSLYGRRRPALERWTDHDRRRDREFQEHGFESRSEQTTAWFVHREKWGGMIDLLIVDVGQPDLNGSPAG